ncbi:nuclear transport factor 2 family protein [Thermoleptolyngbya sichuanensis XZ-Cy5]|uniref:nuclear transport factor 2 family protein n=1 Tax=Thermoleptolyngbya sichuanensis TaxID=2885951 RepID=UPI00240D31AC|nr:nuclear transport factor 2 family protein [Thermoleptolyngbya sichuanensis]MDG2615321.1 nuclear transport factor 2 family protein [Thermoleptolyngbya sichuanensis XZ-Cy5]
MQKPPEFPLPQMNRLNGLSVRPVGRAVALRLGMTRRDWRRANLVIPAVLLGVLLSWAGRVGAQTPPAPAAPAEPAAPTPAVRPAPEELTEAIARLDAAASSRNLRDVMRLFSRNFTHADGLTYDTLSTALQRFWQPYRSLTYQTVLDSWEQDGNALVANTTTTITGTRDINGRIVTLNSVLSTRQRYENGRIVSQSVLSERTEVSSGDFPPSVQVQLPAQVLVGQSFDFDVIVQEPLGDRLLLGAAIEEPVNAQGYLSAAPLNLELLSAGGLFKTGQAPALPSDRWITGVLVREDGIVQHTRRLQVVDDPSLITTPTPAPRRRLPRLR